MNLHFFKNILAQNFLLKIWLLPIQITELLIISFITRFESVFKSIVEVYMSKNREFFFYLNLFIY